MASGPVRVSWMRRRGMVVAAAAMVAAGTVDAAPTEVRMLLETDAGTIEAMLDVAAAPITSCNVMRYVAGGHYDGGRFFRTVRSAEEIAGKSPIDVIQLEAAAGEEHDAFGAIALERTSATGLSHRAGSLSMARWGPDTATSSFSIVALDSPAMDAGGARAADGQGFAVFGRVLAGMDVVAAIHASPARDERLTTPVRIVRALLRDAAGIGIDPARICSAIPASHGPAPSRRPSD